MKSTTLIAAVVVATTILVPVAQADSGFQGNPDAVERAVAAKLAATSFQGAPDAIERAVDARESLSTFQGSPDAIDRARSAQQVRYAPDALERALVTGANGRSQAIAAPAVDVPTSSGGLDWSDFGLGAGVGLGSALLLTGLGLGVLTLRRGGRVTTA